MEQQVLETAFGVFMAAHTPASATEHQETFTTNQVAEMLSEHLGLEVNAHHVYLLLQKSYTSGVLANEFVWYTL